MAELVEGARLEIAYTLIAYQGFESLSLRQKSAVVLMELRRILHIAAN